MEMVPMAILVQTQSGGSVNLGGPAAARPDAASLLSLLVRPARVARTWWRRHQAREQLISLDEHMLRDIGMTRGQAVLEWQKGFWEA
jgi:uncharacterized protein YjiS (DUF1127 family)